MSATNRDVQVLSDIRCPRRCCFDLVHASVDISHFERNSWKRDFVFVFVFAVFVVVGMCIFVSCDFCVYILCVLCVVARVFVISNMFLFFLTR